MKEYIELKRRIVYRGDAYQAINDELIKVSAYAISSEYRRGVEDGMKRALGVLAHRVKDIPAANVVEVIHAHWVWDGYDYEKPWACSNCRCHSESETKYCPNCGAKMDAEEDDKQ